MLAGISSFLLYALLIGAIVYAVRGMKGDDEALQQTTVSGNK